MFFSEIALISVSKLLKTVSENAPESSQIGIQNETETELENDFFQTPKYEERFL